MRTGYQRELTYKHDDGAYSAFGNRDKEGSTWLTAFVLKSYAQAQPWIDVDEKELKETFKWLQSKQGPDGCFAKVGKLHNKAMAGGVKTPATLTAYILISLIEAGYKDHRAVTSGLSCVLDVFTKFESSPETADSYSLSIFAYFFAKMGAPSYTSALNLLDTKAIKNDGMVHWEEKKSKDNDNVPYYYKARSTDIEQTAYVLLAKLAHDGKDGINTAVPIVKWLAKQRNSLGGWSSTQDTVLAMQALAEFAELSFSSGTNIKVSVKADDFDHVFNIDSNNKLVLQRVEDVPVPATLTIEGEGNGCALVQTSVSYNVHKVDVEPSFKLKYFGQYIDEKPTIRQSCRPQTIEVCATWQGEEEESNMAIVEVQMVSGFVANEDQFDEVRSRTKHLKDIEIKEKSVMFYFSRIGKTEQCIKFRVDQETAVRKAKPAFIRVYDYYDTGKSETLTYNFSSLQCGTSKKLLKKKETKEPKSKP